jgi:hypothetical protein
MKLKREDKHTIEKYYNDDCLTIEQIADKFNVCRGTMSSYMKRQGIKTKRVDISSVNRGKYKEAHPRWKGGKLKDRNGYVLLNVPNHPHGSAGNGRYIHEHRYVMEKHIGRYLLPDETVHHKNGIRDDNRISNLELWSSKHGYGQRVEDKVNQAVEILREYKPELLNRKKCQNEARKPTKNRHTRPKSNISCLY